jgi:hypothetical protein
MRDIGRDSGTRTRTRGEQCADDGRTDRGLHGRGVDVDRL